jgi:hypothetical protein
MLDGGHRGRSGLVSARARATLYSDPIRRQVVFGMGAEARTWT